MAIRRESRLPSAKELPMKTNEGTLDRALRVVAGVALLGATAAGMIGPWGWIGVVPLATAAIGWCPLYTVLGINTCGLKR
jgi:hypothetical protein